MNCRHLRKMLDQAEAHLGHDDFDVVIHEKKSDQRPREKHGERKPSLHLRLPISCPEKSNHQNSNG